MVCRPDANSCVVRNVSSSNVTIQNSVPIILKHQKNNLFVSILREHQSKKCNLSLKDASRRPASSTPLLNSLDCKDTLLLLLDVSNLVLITMLKSPAQIHMPWDSVDINSKIFFVIFFDHFVEVNRHIRVVKLFSVLLCTNILYIYPHILRTPCSVQN